MSETILSIAGFATILGILLLLLLLIPLQIGRKEKHLQHRKHDKKLNQNNTPQRAPQSHPPETVRIEPHYPA